MKKRKVDISMVPRLKVELETLKLLLDTQEKVTIEQSLLLEKKVGELQEKEKHLRKAYVRLQEMQEQVIQSAKLNAVGVLASGVAHEVRNPLAIILQGVNYLEDNKSLPGEIREVLESIKNNIKRADKIINLLLDFSKATRLSLEPEDVNSILESSLGLLKNKLEASGRVSVCREFKTDIPKIRADKNKLEQVFINLLLNSLQAMPDGGTITIRSYAEQLGEASKGIGRRDEDYFKIGEQAIVVEIEDTGVGISEESLRKIFDPFYTTKSPQEGSGLGLSVSRNIINMHKGLINVKSRLGRGTKVTIVLKVSER